MADVFEKKVDDDKKILIKHTVEQVSSYSLKELDDIIADLEERLLYWKSVKTNAVGLGVKA